MLSDSDCAVNANRLGFPVAASAGNVLLEMVFVIFLGVVVISGIVDYGSALQEHSVMVDAARMGARVAVKQGDPDSNSLSELAVRAAVTFLREYGLRDTDYQFRIADETSAGISQIRFTVTRVTNRFVFMVNQNFPSCAAAIFRVESGVSPAGGTFSVNGVAISPVNPEPEPLC